MEENEEHGNNDDSLSASNTFGRAERVSGSTSTGNQVDCDETEAKKTEGK